jgi:hypothetical protein
MTAIDFKNLFAQIRSFRGKHRMPEEPEGVYLLSLLFAGELLGDSVKEKDFPRVHQVATELQRVAGFYYKLCLEQARGHGRKAGRPQHKADIGFIYAMSRLWEKLFGPPKFRIYQAARKKKQEIGGRERATKFQRVCNKWMQVIDPDRPRPLAPAAFKSANQYYTRRSPHQ